MNEVKRYHVTEAGLVEGSALGRLNVVLGADHDRVTARLKEGITKHWQIVCDQRSKIDALQALLTAADERADSAITFVTRLIECAGGQPSIATGYLRDILDTLKPTESGTGEHICPGCGTKGWTANCDQCVPY